MTDLPFQKWFEGDFERDTKTMSFELSCVYRAVLQVMWANHGWLPGDDGVCARMLRCDVRSWRAYKRQLLVDHPRLLAEVDPLCGPILRQKRVVKDWSEALEVQAKNKERSAKAAAASAAVRSSKSTKGASNKLSSKQAPNGELQAEHGAELGGARRALARKPEPEEPSSQRDDGSGSPLPPAPAHPPTASGGLAGSTVEAFTGPFMPAAKPPPRPAGTTRFLEQYERHLAGDPDALKPVAGAPVNSRLAAEAQAHVMAAANTRFVPTGPPPGTTLDNPGATRAGAMAAHSSLKPSQELLNSRIVKDAPKEEDHHERQPEGRGERTLDDDDLDDLIRF